MSSINEINNILSSIQMDRKDKAKLARKLNTSNVEIVHIDPYDITFEELLKYKDRYINSEIIFRHTWDEQILDAYYDEDCIYINTIAPVNPLQRLICTYFNTGEIIIYESMFHNDYIIGVYEDNGNVVFDSANFSLQILKSCAGDDINIFYNSNFILEFYNGAITQKLNCNVEIDEEYNTVTLRASNDKYSEITIIIDFNAEDIYVENAVLRTGSENALPHLVLMNNVRYHDRTYQALLNIIENGGIVQIKFNSSSIENVIKITNYSFDYGKIYLYTLNGKYEFQEKFTDEYWITEVTE